jgi:hypothetical protein
MFRADKSPVRRVPEFMHAHFPEIGFVVCGNPDGNHGKMGRASALLHRGDA